MDAAQQTLKNTALFLATALLAVVPVRAQSPFTANPNPVQLTGTATFVSVSIAGSGNFTITQSGSFFNTGGATSGTAPTSITVGLTSTVCSNGGTTACNGSITLHPTSVSGTSQDLVIPVTFTPGSGGGGGGGGGNNGVIVANPNPVTLNANAGQSTSTNVTLTTSSANSIGFSFTTTPANLTSWLSVSVSSNQISSASSVNMNVFVSALGLTTSQTGSITITPTNGGTQTVIPVNFNINGSSGNSTYSLNPPSIAFSSPNDVNAKTVVVFNSASLTTYNAIVTSCSSGNFLLLNGLNQAFNQAVANGLILTLTNLGSFATGSYSCNVQVSNPSNSNDFVNLPVTLSVNGGGSNGQYVVSQNQINYTSAAGSTNTQPQNIGITSTSGATLYNATFSSNSGVQFITMNSSTLQTITNQTVANGLNIALNQPQTFSPGTYSGTITLSNPNGTGQNTTINIFLTVTGGSTGGSYTVSQNTFNFQSNGTQSGSVTVTSPTQTQFVATSTSNGNLGNWITLAQSGVSQGSTIIGTTSQPMSIFLNSGAIPTVQGSYTGQVKISNPSNSNDFVNITVNLQVGTGTGSNLSFSTSPGVIPASQQITVTSPGGANYITGVLSNGNFITSPVDGATYTPSQPLTVSVNPGNLAAGTYTGTITLSTNGVSFNVISVTLTISGSGGGGGGGGTGSLVAPTSLTFAYQTGGQVQFLPQQSITIAASGSFTVSSSQNWIAVSPLSGTGPANLTVSVIPTASGLFSGTNQGVINITTPSGSQSVTVNLIITSSMVLIPSPGSINFNYSAGSQPFSGILGLTSSDGSSTPVTVTPQQNWITVSSTSTSTPTQLTVTANPSGLCNGINAGSITVTGGGAANSPVTIPVIALVSGSSTTGCGSSTGPLTLSPTTISLTAASNGAAATQTLSVTAPSSSTFYTATTNTNSGGNWLSVLSPCTSCFGTQNLTIQASPSGLAAGTYQGNVVLTTNGATQQVPVTFTVGASGASGSITVNGATQASLTFTAQLNGAAPAGQNVAVASSTAGVGYVYQVSTTSGGSWLSATSNGTTLANGQSLNTTNNPTLTVNANPSGLTAGTYSGTITLSPNGGSAVTISVTLTVQANGISVGGSGTVSFTYTAGDAVPSAQTVQVNGPQGGTFTSQNSFGNCPSGWFTVSPTSGSTGGSVSVGLNTANVTVGTCNGTITLTGTGTATGTATISVSATVTAPLPTIDRVTSAASFIGQSVSPGEVITIFGKGLGPTPFVTLVLDSTGKVATSLGGVQVLVGGIPAPMIFASNTQVSAVVPYDIAFLQTTTVIVKFLNQTSNGISVQVTPTTTAIFTANASGTGPGAILNPNNSANTPSNPANKGDTVAIYLTGEGQTSPAGVNGKVTTVSPTPPLTPAPLLPVAVLIDGQPAAISFAGEAPGIVSGVMQLNVQIPAGARTGNLPLIVSIGGVSSQNGVTVSVK